MNDPFVNREGRLTYLLILIQNRVIATGIPGVTADDAPESEPGTADDAESFYRLIRILGAGRVESAGTARDNLAQHSMIERERLLIESDKSQDRLFHKIESESHPPSPKASAGRRKSIKSKVRKRTNN